MSIIDSNARWEDEDKAMAESLEQGRINVEGEMDLRFYQAKKAILDSLRVMDVEGNESMKITFYGSSDDLVEIGGVDNLDEINTNNELERFRVLHQDEAGTVEGIAVEIEYGKKGLWSAKVEPIDDGFPIPDWLIRIGRPHYSEDYSTMLIVYAPQGTIVEHVTD